MKEKGLTLLNQKALLSHPGLFYANFMQIPKSAEIPGNDRGSKHDEISVDICCNNQLELKFSDENFLLKVFDK